MFFAFEDEFFVGGEESKSFDIGKVEDDNCAKFGESFGFFVKEKIPKLFNG